MIAELKKAVYKEANEYLNEKFGGWRNIVREGVRYGIDKAHELLQNAKESIVCVIKENEKLFRALTQGAVKGGARLAAEYAAKEATREGAKMILNAGGKSVAKAAASRGAKHVVTQGTKRVVTHGTKKVIAQGSKRVIAQGSKRVIAQGSKRVIAQSSKRVVAQGGKRLASQGTKQVVTQGVKQGMKSAATAATGVGLVADLAQAGLEYYGYEKTGKTVGASGNIASGALFGATIGGPPGAAIGALGGFVIWGTGEFVGKFIDKSLQ